MCPSGVHISPQLAVSRTELSPLRTQRFEKHANTVKLLKEIRTNWKPLDIDWCQNKLVLGVKSQRITLHILLIISLEMFGTGIILLHAHPQVVCIQQLCKVSSAIKAELCLQDSTFEHVTLLWIKVLLMLFFSSTCSSELREWQLNQRNFLLKVFVLQIILNKTKLNCVL